MGAGLLNNYIRSSPSNVKAAEKLGACDRKDEERQCRPDAGLYQVRQLIRENVRENKNPPLKFRIF
jgi:hypothetical protein